MASSSSKALEPSFSFSSSYHSVMYSGKWEYDVFVCFRGADTRDGFTSHLMEALSREQIKAFIDDKLDKTESIDDELASVLQRSPLSIVVFSENFADSSWCLDEVATISQSMKQFGHQVLPVFYKVDPSDVAEDSGSYVATIKLKHGTSSILEDRQRWMDALKAVAKCAGHTSQAIKIDSELVKMIVKDVLKRLVEMSPRVKSDSLIGMDTRVSEVEKLLAMDMDDFRIIGLWGMGGVGKTTLAKACYQSFLSSGKEMKHHFVQNINEKFEKQSGIEGLVEELYSILLSEDNLNYQNLDISYRRDRLSRSRVFLVPDNVETLLQLEQLLLGDILKSTDLFAPRSRIILTTRNRRVLDDAGAYKYHVECLYSHESLQLFGIHAFRLPFPPDDWRNLSDAAINYCKGSPLAIKVLGGALLHKEKGYWESFLGELGKIPRPEILDVLRRSYEGLGTVEKGVFLDIACFCYHQLPKSFWIRYFSTNSRADHVIEDLIDKSLLSCVSVDTNIGLEMIEVHDLLRGMSWSIVNEEPKLENRSRLNNCDDISKLLAIRKGKEKHSSAFLGSKAIEGMELDLSKVSEVHLEANAFEGMTSLRYLGFVDPRYLTNHKDRVSKVRVPNSSLVTLPDSLKWLHWDGFPSKYMPTRFSPENLIILAIRHNRLIKRCWKVQPKLVNLMTLNLSYCINVVSIPNLSMSPNLEYLILQGCESLIQLPSHVQHLDKLKTLDLRDCTNLRRLPATLKSKCLEAIYLSNCPKMAHCPEINLGELKTLDLMETPVFPLPSAIYYVKPGAVLRLCGKHITNFPAISTSLNQFRLCHTAIREMDCYDDDHHPQGSLPRFVRLELVDNPQLKRLSGIPGRWSLKHSFLGTAR